MLPQRILIIAGQRCHDLRRLGRCRNHVAIALQASTQLGGRACRLGHRRCITLFTAQRLQLQIIGHGHEDNDHQRRGQSVQDHAPDAQLAIRLPPLVLFGR